MNSIEFMSMLNMTNPINNISSISPVSSISRDDSDIKDIDSDSSTSIGEWGSDEGIFASLESNSKALETQNEIASAIDTSLSNLNGEMPNKEEFASLLSDLGLDLPSSNEEQSYQNTSVSGENSNEDTLVGSKEFALSNEESEVLDITEDASVSQENQTAKDNIQMLFDALKMNSEENETPNADNFKNIISMVNKQNNNSDLNAYLQDETYSSRTSSYA